MQDESSIRQHAVICMDSGGTSMDGLTTWVSEFCVVLDALPWVVLFFPLEFGDALLRSEYHHIIKAKGNVFSATKQIK